MKLSSWPLVAFSAHVWRRRMFERLRITKTCLNTACRHLTFAHEAFEVEFGRAVASERDGTLLAHALALSGRVNCDGLQRTVPLEPFILRAWNWAGVTCSGGERDERGKDKKQAEKFLGHGRFQNVDRSPEATAKLPSMKVLSWPSTAFFKRPLRIARVARAVCTV